MAYSSKTVEKCKQIPSISAYPPRYRPLAIGRLPPSLFLFLRSRTGTGRSIAWLSTGTCRHWIGVRSKFQRATKRGPGGSMVAIPSKRIGRVAANGRIGILSHRSGLDPYLQTFSQRARQVGGQGLSPSLWGRGSEAEGDPLRVDARICLNPDGWQRYRWRKHPHPRLGKGIAPSPCLTPHPNR